MGPTGTGGGPQWGPGPGPGGPPNPAAVTHIGPSQAAATSAPQGGHPAGQGGHPAGQGGHPAGQGATSGVAPSLPPPYPAPHGGGGGNAPLRIENDSIQALYKSVKLVQKLRSAVSLTFQHLADGVTRVTPNEVVDDANNAASSSSSSEVTSVDGIPNVPTINEDEKALVEELKKNLKKVGDSLTEVENHVGQIQDQAPQQHYPRSASFMLNLDSVNVAEKHQLSTQLYHSHRWLDKLHEFSSVSSTVLTQNSNRRSAATTQGGRDVASGPLAAKRIKLKGPASQQVSVAPAAIDQFVTELSHNFKNNMTIKLSRPLGNPALLNISLARTLKAYVILRGLIIEWVNILGFGEMQANDFDVGEGDNDNVSLDTVWTKSKHHVFKRISEHAAAAMIHFYLPNNPELALRSFLMWLRSYEKLFYDPCHACEKIIQSSDGSVPVFRDLRTLKPYHDLCRP